MTRSTSPSRAEKVCALCGASLDGFRPDARFCDPSCRVEAGRIRAILSPANPEPYLSVAERLRSAQEAYKPPLVGNASTLLDVASPSLPQTAIGRLLSCNFGRRQLRNPEARRPTANEQLRLPV